VPRVHIALETSPTYGNSTSALAFRVDANLVLPVDQPQGVSIPDPHLVVAVLSTLTQSQLLDLLGTVMVNRGLRIISVDVFGPDLIMLSAPPPAPLGLPLGAPAQPVALPLRGIDPSLLGTAHEAALRGHAAALVASFIVALVVPLVTVYWLYRRRKSFEEHYHSHLSMRRYRRPSQLPLASDMFADGALDRENSWSGRKSDRLHAGHYENACEDNRSCDSARSVESSENSQPHGEHSKATAARSHIEIRRRQRRSSGGADDPLGSCSLQHKGSWFDVPEGDPRLASQTSGGGCDMESEGSEESEVAASPEDGSDLPSYSRVARSHLAIRRRQRRSSAGPDGALEDGVVRDVFTQWSGSLFDNMPWSDGHGGDPRLASQSSTTGEAWDMDSEGSDGSEVAAQEDSSGLPSSSRVPRSHVAIRRRQRRPSGGAADPLDWCDASWRSNEGNERSEYIASPEDGSDLPSSSRVPRSHLEIRRRQRRSSGDAAEPIDWSDASWRSSEGNKASEFYSSPDVLRSLRGASVPPVSSRVPRSHVQIRRRQRRPAGGAGDPLSPRALQHKSSWFDVPEGDLRLASQRSESGEASDTKGESSAAQTTPACCVPACSSSPLSLPVEEPQSPRCTCACDIPQHVVENVDGGGASDAIDGSTRGSRSETNDAASRSDAVLARARARSRARSEASPAAPVSAPLSVSIASQQDWLVAAMSAAGEQDNAPLNVQHDWLAQIFHDIDDGDDDALSTQMASEECTPSTTPRPSAATRMLSRRSSASAEPSRRASTVSEPESPLQSPWSLSDWPMSSPHAPPSSRRSSFSWLPSTRAEDREDGDLST